jgi:hypothetical protein
MKSVGASRFGLKKAALARRLRMNVSPAEQVFEEILPYLEILDAQIGGVVQLLKDKGITTNEEFAQYVERADKESNVREVGLRVRMEFLFSSAAKRSASKESGSSVEGGTAG